MNTQARWRRVQDLVEALEAVTPEEHRDQLERIEPDESLRRDTLGILAAIHDEETAQEALRPRAIAIESAPAPKVIRDVRLLEHLGSGGSGDVFRGVRTVNGAEQLVAVKFLHAHRVSAAHLERFHREQQLLAALTHPDIIRFLDAGLSDDGQPYLVMELAEGQPITTYSDDGGLRVDDRLRLMLSVCEAVQSAHRHLIVHLDLKPSNILVSADGHVKLLDFGAAKLMDATGQFTRTEPMTLLYASPERLRGEPVSVACDVYSLGVLLYELVSGAWPFERRDSFVAVAERAAGHLDILPIAEGVTARAATDRSTSPERLRATLRGDIEAICAKALAHRASDRYASVADLGDDVQRYLAGEPVRARALGWPYRVGKFVRRRAWAVAGAAALVVGLASAAVYSNRQAQVATSAAAAAQAQNRFLTSLFVMTGNDAASRHDMTVKELLALAASRVPTSLGDNPAVAVEIEIALAEGYVAQTAFAEAQAVLERAIARASAAHDIAREARARAKLAYIRYAQNQNGEATEQARAALDLWSRQRDAFPPAQAFQTVSEAAMTLSYLDPTSAVPGQYFEVCLDLARRYPADINPLARTHCLRGLGTSYANVHSRYDEADALLREAIGLLRTDPPQATTLAMTLQMLGLVNRFRGRFAEDEEAQREAYDITARLQGAESTAATWQRSVWAFSLLGLGRLDEAYIESQRILAAGRKMYPTRGSYLLWTPLSSATSAACMLERMAECEALATEAIETLGATPAPIDPRLAAAGGLLGIALSARGDHQRARPLLERALAINAERQRTPPYLRQLQAALARSNGTQ